MNKLVVVIMGQNCEKFIGMCLESVKDADAIVYCDGGSVDGTIKIVEDFHKEMTLKGDNEKTFLIKNPYDQEDPQMNGKQRNFYLKWIKKEYPHFWALVLDADEVVDNLTKIKEFIQKAKDGLYSVHMRHFHNDLGHEDAIVDKHWVLNRLFKISEADSYPEVEHPVLQGKVIGNTDCTTVFHLAHINHCFNIKERYEKNMKHSNIHSPEFLDYWKDAHMLGRYPMKPVDIMDIPDVILKNFHINKDKFYFANRGLELKHFIDAIHWRDFFECKDAIEFGCGRGPRVFAMNQIGIEGHGFELSEFAVKNKIHDEVFLGDATTIDQTLTYDLSIAYDLLEHIPYEKLNDVINNLIKLSDKYILISIPVIGDPNLEADKTHIIKETKEWWIKQFTDKGLKLIKTPEHFLYKEQLMIFEKCAT